MPSAPPALNRRSLLISAVPAALALGLLAGTTACAPPAPPADLNDLRAQLDRAESDSRLAGEAALAARVPMVATLTAIAAERTAHARALSDEITRLTGGDAATTSETPTAGSTAAPAAKPTVAAVARALHESADEAARLAAQLSGYRAGLLGSIAASCTASYQVALGDPENRP